MPSPISIGTRDIPLKLAKTISEKVNLAWDSGEFLDKTTAVTQDLLKFWFTEPHIENRYINFHSGQRQAILNTIYLHEILGTKSVKDIYENIEFELLPEIDIAELKKPKYEIPKYAIKMATGTGKTWVMHALLAWQYLNAKYETQKSGKFSKNFLLVAPGIIVYERLLDAYLGKENENQERQFEQSDFYQFKDLLLPPAFREEFFGFIQSAVSKKQEIGSKVTGDGLIAIANWHLFMSEEESEGESLSPLDSPQQILKDIMPIRPGVSGGNSLDALDSAYWGGRELDYLANLPDLVCINDEAHHIHENKTYGEVSEVEWQKSLNKIAASKGDKFMQIDFSATPYDVTGSGQNRVKHYFPHTIVDFKLKTAIDGGFVKTIAIDKRKELVDLPLDFKSVRDEKNTPIALSDGQKLMIRAGLNRLKILEKEFVKFTKDANGVSNKYPKMLIMCEDTKVTPLVEAFFRDEGLSEDEVLRVDSNKKGQIPEVEWKELKQRLFNIDKHDKPKVIISVLMLREGFDVNNICVIVPLRSSAAPILLEQTIGRGLRLMWREPEYHEAKMDNIRQLIKEKREPKYLIDLLFIIEHPAFLQFYEDLDKESIVEVGDITDGGVLGDIIKVGLKPDWQKYDMYWPVIVRDMEEEISGNRPPVEKMEKFTVYTLENLKKFFHKDGEKFVSEELTVKTRFGEYMVDASLFTSQSYNEYLQKIIHAVVNRTAKTSARGHKVYPTLQINQLQLVEALDFYIRNLLFGSSFDPFVDNNWKVLLLKNGIVTQHIVRELGKLIFEMQNNTSTSEALIEKRHFAEVDSLRMRENYSLPIVKTIYERLRYPSNKGGFEKDFLIYADGDGQVEAIIKIEEYQHTFAVINYMRSDGFLAQYHPDFLVQMVNKIYLIETKADKDIDDKNVRQKQLATLDWIKRINGLKPEARLNKEWEYVLLGESNFYALSKNGASLSEICELAKVSEAAVAGRLI